MKKEQAPLAIALVIAIVVAVAFVVMRGRSGTNAGPAVIAPAAPASGSAPVSGAEGGTNYASPSDEARAKGQFTPANR